MKIVVILDHGVYLCQWDARYGLCYNLTMFHLRKIQGFTLVEILIVVFLIMILATAAISSYVNSNDTFKFLSGYKQAMSVIRTARSYAITNKQGDTTPKRYGVCIAQNRAAAFADSGDKELILDLSGPDGAKVNPCPNFPLALGAKFDSLIPEKNFNFTGYTIEAKRADNTPILLPLFLFYDRGTGNLSIFDKDYNLIEKNDSKFISLKFYETNGDLQKFIKIFQVSGMPEEVD